MKNNTNAADTSDELKVSEQTRTIANNIRKEFVLGEGGVITVPKDLLEKNLPEGVTIKDITRVQDVGKTMTHAVSLALGEFAIGAMKKDKKLEQLSIETPFGKHYIGSQIQRERQVPDGKGGQQTKFGVLTSKYTATGTSSSGGDYKRIRDHFSGQFATLFGGSK